MSLHDYKINIEADEIGTDHTCGYCSDADVSFNNIIDINRTCNFSIDVPSKKFVKKYVNSDGDVDLHELYQYNKKHRIYETKKRLCYGSGYCGCSVSTIIKSAKLIENKDNIKSKFMENVSSDDSSDNSSKNEVNTVNSTISRNSFYYVNKKYPKYYSESYKRRCSKIPCKFHPNCKFRNNKDRPCFFMHE